MFHLSSDRQHSTTMLNTSLIQFPIAKAASAATALPYWPMLVEDERRCGATRTLAARLMR